MYWGVPTLLHDRKVVINDRLQILRELHVKFDTRSSQSGSGDHRLHRVLFQLKIGALRCVHA